MALGGEIVQRLNSHGISRQEQLVPLRIPDCEAEHASQFCQATFTPAPVSPQQHFRIGMAAKRGALALQGFANLPEVVNLTVVGNPVSGLRIVHRLMTKGREIKNRESTIA